MTYNLVWECTRSGVFAFFPLSRAWAVSSRARVLTCLPCAGASHLGCTTHGLRLRHPW
jgi:hypothetical protein